MLAEATNIPLEMLAVFGAAKLLAEVFERLKQPAMVGEIIAGVLIGPSVLGWVAPNPVLNALGDLGVLFLLFGVGLEVRAHELRRVGGTAAMVAILGVIAPFLLGWGIMAASGATRVESFFVAASMVATSVGITAHVLASKGWIHDRASQTILAAAVIDDVLGLIVLSMVTSLARDHVRLLELVSTALIAIGFTVVMVQWGTRTVNRVAPHLESRLLAGQVQFNLAMLLLFALAVAAGYAGVAAIVGAFLAGMAFSDTVTERVRDSTGGVSELLTPFFLAGIGLQLDLSVFGSMRMISLALAILGAAVFSKLIGCGLGAARMGRQEMLRVGVGMIPRGEVGMVVAQLGMSMGVIPKPVYAVVVFMAVATTLIAPPLLNMAYRGVTAETPLEDTDLI